MGTNDATRRIDEKGRITLPKAIRDRLGLRAGEAVDIDVEDGRIVVEPRVSRAAFVEAMEGVIDAESRRRDAPELTPADLKDDWTSDLPTDS